jgi:hypothetical protein
MLFDTWQKQPRVSDECVQVELWQLRRFSWRENALPKSFGNE